MLQKIAEKWMEPGRKRLALMAAILVMTLVCGAMVRLKAEAGRAGRRSGAEQAQDERAQTKGAESEEAAQTEGTESEEKTSKKTQAGNEGAETTFTSAELAEIEAVEASIVPGKYPIMGASSIQLEQMIAYFEEQEEKYPAKILGEGGAPDIETFCRIYYEEAVKEGVRPEVAFAQTMKETGWLQYGGDAKIEQYNFAGLGTTGGGVPGNSYPDVRTGVRAQIQHLKAYATDDKLEGECVDDRYTYVKKGSAPYVEWLGQKENPKGRGWATGENYGYDIVEMIHAMRKPG